MTADRMRIFIRDCRVNLAIGHYDHEMRRTQPVLITVECDMNLTRRYDDIKENDLASVYNYRPLYQFLRDDLTKMGHIHLLESAAEKIIDFCMTDPRIITARVRIEKTAIFPDAAGAGVDMQRTRTQA